MAHPQMFDDEDPLLARVRRVALALPGAAEKVSHGRPAFFTTKVFAYYGGSVKLDGGWVQHERSVMVLACSSWHPPADRALTPRPAPRFGLPAAG